ncbi:MAG: endonuclease III [Candidatus Bipolaricaulota bacterium]|nr:endonuclease III [Candidatus Bipolaricaulota bacterium]MDW8126308.1 endonuclease III [Candidatus Bipolaricaulota bacterium]
MEPKERMAAVDARLRATFGEPQRPKGIAPLELLIRTILSQNTSDRNRDLAYTMLRQRFPSWQEVLEAPLAEVAAAIRPAGLHKQRAKRIKDILRRIKEERAEIELTFLADLPVEEAEKWLLSLPGVGKKTAYIVLLFAFGQPRFPVDTHISRVTKRVGLWQGKGDPHRALGAIVPSGREYALHLNLIRLGRTFCRPRNPRCKDCPLADLCSTGQKMKEEGKCAERKH